MAANTTCGICIARGTSFISGDFSESGVFAQKLVAMNLMKLARVTALINRANSPKMTYNG